MDSDRISLGGNIANENKAALTKNESLTFEKLKQKWKELSQEVCI